MLYEIMCNDQRQMKCYFLMRWGVSAYMQFLIEKWDIGQTPSNSGCGTYNSSSIVIWWILPREKKTAVKTDEIQVGRL